MSNTSISGPDAESDQMHLLVSGEVSTRPAHYDNDDALTIDTSEG